MQDWPPGQCLFLGMFMAWSAVYLKSSSSLRATLAALLVGKTFVSGLQAGWP